MTTLLHIPLVVVACWLISGTLLNFSKHPHWYIRIWDFPRTFVAALAAAIFVIYAIFFHQNWWDWVLIAGLALVVGRQVYLIYPYTPLARPSVKRAPEPSPEDLSAARSPRDRDSALRLVISNVLQENREFELWLRVVRENDPDVIVAVEVNGAWDAALSSLRADYPFVLRHPQENYYGLAVYSRLPFAEEPKVRFLVQDDVPSAHLTLRLRDGQPVCLHALHPRPPEPVRDQDSAPRDAELVILGREIAEHQRAEPTIVCGDLNDVAWSFTTQLFLRLSRLLDPRRGRGQFNSYNARSRIFRFPLDHVFHSDEFQLIDLRVLPYVGSDHFPVLIELCCLPEQARRDQSESRPRADDQQQASEIVQEQAARESAGEEQGHVSRGQAHG